MTSHGQTPVRLLAGALGLLSLTSLLFLAISSARGAGLTDWYLAWNLVLAWVPAVLAYWLTRVLVRDPTWTGWPAIGLSLGWLLFLPNSFYIVSDLIHLEDMPRSEVLFDAVMFSLFVITGLLLGFASLYAVHVRIRERVSALRAAALVSLLLFLCSFAIYLGRTLRWNSWDVLVNPAGILFDVSERVIDPFDHPATYAVTATFFVFLSCLYWAGWLTVRAISRQAELAAMPAATRGPKKIVRARAKRAKPRPAKAKRVA